MSARVIWRGDATSGDGRYTSDHCRVVAGGGRSPWARAEKCIGVDALGQEAWVECDMEQSRNAFRDALAQLNVAGLQSAS